MSIKIAVLNDGFIYQKPRAKSLGLDFLLQLYLLYFHSEVRTANTIPSTRWYIG